MKNLYHATPYDMTAIGFYFRTYEEYLEKAKTHKNKYGDPVEEYEIQFLDGENYALFGALSVNQANLKQWFDEFEGLEGNELVSAIYLAEYLSYNMDDLKDSLDDVSLFEGTAKEYAYEYIDDTGLLNEMPENLRFYFDFDAFTRDMIMSGDITEVTINNTNYIAWGV